MSGWIWPISPDATGLTVSIVVHANVGWAADANTNALTPTTTATTAKAMIGVRNRWSVDCSS